MSTKRLLLCALFSLAAQTSAHATASGDGTAAPRYTLKQTRVEAAPPRSGRYTLRARLAPAESAGELRDGGDFTLIGRFAKAAANCGIGGAAIFRDGFDS
jgi:hypothetical protein